MPAGGLHNFWATTQCAFEQQDGVESASISWGSISRAIALLVSQDLHDCSGDPFAQMYIFASMLYFTIFILNTFVGIISDEYKNQQAVVRRAFLRQRAVGCHHFLLRTTGSVFQRIQLLCIGVLLAVLHIWRPLFFAGVEQFWIAVPYIFTVMILGMYGVANFFSGIPASFPGIRNYLWLAIKGDETDSLRFERTMSERLASLEMRVEAGLGNISSHLASLHAIQRCKENLDLLEKSESDALSNRSADDLLVDCEVQIRRIRGLRISAHARDGDRLQERLYSLRERRSGHSVTQLGGHFRRAKTSV